MNEALEKLVRIVALCENPHWSADRKQRIADLANEVKQIIMNHRPERQETPATVDQTMFVIMQVVRSGRILYYNGVHRTASQSCWTQHLTEAKRYLKQRARQIANELQPHYGIKIQVVPEPKEVGDVQ